MCHGSCIISRMNISEVVSFDKEGRVEYFPLWRRLFLALVIILVATLSFGIGRLSVVGDREPLRIEYDPQLTTDNSQPTQNKSQTASAINAVSGGEVITSKNGNKYHYPYCPGAKQIKEENKVIFASATAAEAAGYTLAANCLPR